MPTHEWTLADDRPGRGGPRKRRKALTISGDSSHFTVTVEVLDTVTKQRLAVQTFEVRGTTTFGGTTPAQAPVGLAGIECRIAKVL
ncbi:hypothetical protein GCM10023195_62390 [Actinoallomurus liliacearum]|uniref:Uncharacterized protein n=1 Tax=Actinoallomurus liliacearum TaxID=1080073 RepID=A0ABP8TV15_9ACTN